MAKAERNENGTVVLTMTHEEALVLYAVMPDQAFGETGYIAFTEIARSNSSSDDLAAMEDSKVREALAGIYQTLEAIQPEDPEEVEDEEIDWDDVDLPPNVQMFQLSPGVN